MWAQGYKHNWYNLFFPLYNSSIDCEIIYDCVYLYLGKHDLFRCVMSTLKCKFNLYFLWHCKEVFTKARKIIKGIRFEDTWMVQHDIFAPLWTYIIPSTICIRIFFIPIGIAYRSMWILITLRINKKIITFHSIFVCIRIFELKGKSI